MTRSSDAMEETTYIVEQASPSDAQDVLACVRELLVDLTGDEKKRLADGAADLFAKQLSTGEGIFIIARDGTTEATVGVITATVSSAIRVGGNYAIIQEFYVAPEHRRSRVGSRILAALIEVLRRKGLLQVEVGLPRDEYVELTGLRGVYQRSGFTSIGQRMRLTLSSPL